jgi:hypothetical protein
MSRHIPHQNHCPQHSSIHAPHTHALTHWQPWRCCIRTSYKLQPRPTQWTQWQHQSHLPPISTRAQHFPSNLYPYSSAATYAHPCPPMLFKLRPCFQKLCNVYYPPTPSLGWIGQIKGRSLSLASARSAFWLTYSMHPRSLNPIWSWMQGCTKPMHTHAHPKHDRSSFVPDE